MTFISVAGRLALASLTPILSTAIVNISGGEGDRFAARDAAVEPADVDHDAGDDDRAAVSPVAPRADLVLQLGHYGPVRSVAFSRDGTRVLTGSQDNTARIWDTVTGLEVRSIQTDSLVYCATLSPDGTRAITAHSDRKPARVWEVATGREVGVISGAGARVCFSPDGKYVLGSSADYRDYTVRLWDAASGAEVRAFKGHVGGVQTGGVKSVAFSADGRQGLTAGDSTARLWNVVTGLQTQVFRTPQTQKGRSTNVITAALSPDGTQVLTGGSDAVVRLWDVASGEEVRQFHGHDITVNAVAFSPDGKRAVSGGCDPFARLWDITTGKQVCRLSRHEHEVLSVAFSPDGTRVATGSIDHTARLWDAASGREIHTFTGRASAGIVASVAFSRDGQSWLMGSSQHTGRQFRPAAEPTNAAHLWDASKCQKLRSFSLFSAVSNVVFSPIDSRFLTQTRERVSSWDLVTGEELHWYQNAGGFRCVAVSPAGRLVLADTKAAKLWDLADGKEVRALRLPSPPKKLGVPPPRNVPFPPSALDMILSASVSEDGTRVVTATQRHLVSAWNAASGLQGRTLGGNTGDSRTGTRYSSDHPVHLSPDGKSALTGSFNDNAVARLWDVESGRELATFKGHVGLLRSFAFSPDGKRVLTGGDDRTARLWDAVTGKELQTFRGHKHYVTSVAISPDGRSVLTGSWDETARLWDAATGKERCRLISFAGDAWAAVTPDNYYMASRGALPGMAFRVGDRAFSFEQFDLKFNRPDKVLAQLDAPADMIAAYTRAYQKRLTRLNFTEEMLGDDFHLPELAIESAVPFQTATGTLKLTVTARDDTYRLDRLHIDVNGVPAYGVAGIDLRPANAKSTRREVEIELSAGPNRVDVSVLNEKGAESLKRSLTVRCDAPPRTPDLYIVAVGVSDYADARFRLAYADKDARDVAALLEGRRGRFGDVKVLRLLNRDATREAILRAAGFLKPARVDDTVVVFFAGHGLLDAKLDYYYATADIDFADPAKRGLPYDAIEGLLDGTRARRKLLLMDTCHSGQLDKDEVQVAKAEKKPEGVVTARTFRSGLTPEVKPKLGLANSAQLLQGLFADLRRGTGAAVVASAGGAEYALESAEWRNGVFTHAVLRGLKGEADRNRDGRVQVLELRDFVEQEVRRLTGGRQSPTARGENLLLDFTLE